MTTILKFLMLLALTLWIGGIVFFAAAVAPSAFAVLPSHHLAGNLVNRTLAILHYLGLACGLIYLVASMWYSARARGTVQAASPRHLAVIAMLVLTAVSHFGIARRMHQLRAQIGVIDDVPRDDPRRLDFNRLHVWSTRIEGLVLVLGVGVLWGTARRLS